MTVAPHQSPLHAAAEDYLNRYGWACMPLRNDDNGLPKRPIVPGWATLQAHMPTIDDLPWQDATGLGIVLGPASNNLAVLDIDSQTLAKAIYTIIKAEWPPMHAVKTIRKRMHLYITELTPSPSSRLGITWEDERIEIEFKAAGTQVAAYPTPGYTVLQDTLAEWHSLAVVWEMIEARLLHHHPRQYKPAAVTNEGAAQTTMPWQTEVKESTRNNTMYVEAHRLREAGMSLDVAIDILTTRVGMSYQDGASIPDSEIRRTVTSAFRKGVVTKVGDSSGPREFSPL